MMEGTEMDYVNERPSPEQKHIKGENQKGFTERRLCMLLLSFGVLCIIQATLNVSLRLSLYSRSRSTPCNTSQFKDQTQGVQIDCERRRNNAFNMLQERFNAQARDKNLLENRISELNNMIKTVQEERDRLRVRVRELEGCLSDSSCPAGWKEINSRCYFLSTESKTWQDSRNYCQSQAADLVVINSMQEQRALYRLDGDSYLLFWIGLHDTAGTFRWVDGSALAAPFWQSGQPDHGGPNNIEDCVEMYHRSPELANWNDARCEDKRKWLCEKAANTC
ncbi:CD209 antigen-like protein A [Notolabrus celidotus]|uniref:CD209 antigen-like protein A n=1 Tax=Notolabrus celidotus TaxID=1203425 RepID=UPI00149057C5|nr:CD209 antigen-like protein A [Notolabrus celidotus]